ncbi:MAG: HAMP domain-containing histidine kinase [Alphaproteobacteria bacterium]|nr:HAMP domain-containing histidine kinase [Alphaproteobacteria bacterium]
MDMSLFDPPSLHVVQSRIRSLNESARALFEVEEDRRVIGAPVAELVTIRYDRPLAFAPSAARSGTRVPEAWRLAEWRDALGERRSAAVWLGPEGAAHGAKAQSFTALFAPLPQIEAPQRDPAASEQIVRLFANLAHEMRTPLNAIIGFGEILANEHFGELSPRYKDYSRDITTAGRYLLAIVNGALEIGRLTGADTIEESTFELQAALRSSLSILESRLAEKAITCRMEPGPPGVMLVADQTKMVQVFTNVLSNAVKYSKSLTTITVSYALSDRGEMTIQFEDAGVGMSEADIRTALLPFGRADFAMERAESGTGLGLPIAKAIIDAHGGRLEIDSKPLSGTTVRVVVPADRVIAPGAGFLSGLA